MLKNPLTYEIMTPQSVGVPDSKLVLGKHSGRHALGLRCEQLGFQFDRRELDEIYRTFRGAGGQDQACGRASSGRVDPGNARIVSRPALRYARQPRSRQGQVIRSSYPADSRSRL